MQDLLAFQDSCCKRVFGPAWAAGGEYLSGGGLQCEAHAVSHGRYGFHFSGYGGDGQGEAVVQDGDDGAGAGGGAQRVQGLAGGQAQSGMGLPGLAEPVELAADPVAAVVPLDGTYHDQLAQQPVSACLGQPTGGGDLGKPCFSALSP
ncbi:hypothetical protein AQJ64_41975 [Streptomyces griseoruber]|uniref:Uncharacterized protein n=1 Tax=Streptomyces griseoruber TaxID=1943 RepID=A0A101SKH7_9ACTN|nr:hypothetical protein AQJ64_41975 [Streptomyces griseoruber]